MRAPPPGQAIYVSKGEQDHGPFAFDELVERMAKNEFAPEDLSWHQGVSQWMPLKKLPEWPTLEEKIKKAKPAAPPPPPKSRAPAPPAAAPDVFEDVAESTPKARKAKKGKNAPPMNLGGGDPAASPAEPASGDVMGKILTGVAVLFFLLVLGIAGFIAYKKWDDILDFFNNL